MHSCRCCSRGPETLTKQGGDTRAAVSSQNQSAFMFVPVFLVPVLYLDYKLELELPRRVFCTIFLLKCVCVIFTLFMVISESWSFFCSCQNRVSQAIVSVKCNIICCNMKAIRTYTSNALLGQLYYFFTRVSQWSISSAMMAINHVSVRGLRTQPLGLFFSPSPSIFLVSSPRLLSCWPSIYQRYPNSYP